MSDLVTLTLTQARDGLLEKKFSSLELIDAHIASIEKNRHLNAFITETFDSARQEAIASDVRLFHQSNVRPLEGLPIALKDLFCTKGVRTTAGSKMLEHFIPFYESTVTQNLKNQGSISLGKTNMDEFAMGSSNLNSAFGPVLSPIKSKSAKNLVPGGSSGGSASAVAGNLCLAAIGSDTGGSIRQPASFCGIVGMKPTYGLCSRFGMIAFASSLDQAGPLTKTVEDSALMLSHMSSYDEKDATSSNRAGQDYFSNLNNNIKNLKIGIPQEYIENLKGDIKDLFRRGVKWLEERGCIVSVCSLPLTSYALPVYYIIAPAEASSNLARYDGVRYGLRAEGISDLNSLYEDTRKSGFGDEVKRRIFIGTHILSAGFFDAYYIKAQKIRRLMQRDFEKVFQDVDLIFTPTTPSGAFALDENPTDPIEMYLNDIFTVTVNLAGLPAISVPCGYDQDNCPLGLQLIGPAFSEQRIYNAALALQESANFV
jgi:aspartyl-tRNA(Asn)/glutamyl-tRNA(Gln) amidotransferase subunit A